MRDAHRGAGFVHVLAAGAGRSVNVDAQILITNLDVDLLVHHRIREYRRETGVAPRLRVEWRDAHEAVHAGLRLQKSIGVLTRDLEDSPLDSRFFTLAHVEDLDLEATPLGPARVH